MFDDLNQLLIKSVVLGVNQIIFDLKRMRLNRRTAVIIAVETCVHLLKIYIEPVLYAITCGLSIFNDYIIDLHLKSLSLKEDRFLYLSLLNSMIGGVEKSKHQVQLRLNLIVQNNINEKLYNILNHSDAY